MHGWLWLWFFFLFLLFLVPTGYGWGYRGWGPPYPNYLRRRSAAGATPPAGVQGAPPNAYGWGIGAELVWLAFIFAVVWLVVGVAWWR